MLRTGHELGASCAQADLVVLGLLFFLLLVVFFLGRRRDFAGLENQGAGVFLEMQAQDLTVMVGEIKAVGPFIGQRQKPVARITVGELAAARVIENQQ